MDLASAYLFMGRFIAHATDGELSDAEWEALVVSFADATRSLGYGADDWQAAAEASGNDYEELLARSPAAVIAHFRACAKHVHEAWAETPEVLNAIHRDLARVARADGHVDPMEAHFLDELERRWRLLASAA